MVGDCLGDWSGQLAVGEGEVDPCRLVGGILEQVPRDVEVDVGESVVEVAEPRLKHARHAELLDARARLNLPPPKPARRVRRHDIPDADPQALREASPDDEPRLPVSVPEAEGARLGAFGDKRVVPLACAPD